MKLELLPRLDPEKIREEIESYSRKPFQSLLSDALNSFPTAAKLKEFADRWPDRYAQYLATIGRLAGYSEKVERVENIHHWIHSASDAELIQKNQELQRAIAELTGDAVEVKAIEEKNE